MKKNGFTLIEILIVVVILGILFTIAVTSSIGFSKRSNEKLYSEKIELVLVAAKQFGQASMDSFVLGACEHLDEPVAEAKCFHINVQNLVDQKYLKIEDIFDPRDKTKSLADLQIEVQYYYDRVYAVVYDNSAIGNGTITINGGSATTNTRSVILELNYDIFDKTDALMCISNTSTCTTWQNYEQFFPWELTAEAGLKTVSAWFKDKDGKQTSVSKDTITFNPSLSAGTFAINNGDYYTGNRNVTLNVSMNVLETGVSSMCISNNDVCTTWQAYDTDASWSLTTGDGLKTVRIWFRDEGGNRFEKLSDTIYLDLISPTNEAITINSGNEYTNNRSVNLILFTEDTRSGMDNNAPGMANGIAGMCISNTIDCTNWEDYSTTKTWTLSDSDGTKTVYVKYRDRAGNVSTVVSDDIVLDRAAPVIGTITINNGDRYTNKSTVSLKISSSDVTTTVLSMCISQTIPCSVWRSYDEDIDVVLSGVDGVKTIYVRFRDILANESDPQATDTIVLDTTHPTLTFTNNENWYKNSNFPSPTTTVNDSNSGLKNFRYEWTNDVVSPTDLVSTNCTGGTLVSFTSETKLDVTSDTNIGKPASTSDDNYLHVCVEDIAGNTYANYSRYYLDVTSGTIAFTNTSSLSSWYRLNTFPLNTVTVRDADAGLQTFRYEWADSITDPTGISSTVCNQGNLVLITQGVKTNVIDETLVGKPNTTSNSHYLHVCIVDLAGNILKRESRYYLDVTATTCTSSGDSTAWTSENRSISWGCSDANSGCDPLFSGDSKLFNISTQTSDIASYIIKDKAGNSRTCPLRTANVYVDKVKPTGSIVINDGTTYTSSINVELDFTYDDDLSGAYQRCVSNTNTSVCPNNNWENSTLTKNWALAGTDGTKRVYVWFRDRAHNVSIEYSDTIILDSGIPEKGTITINGGDEYTKVIDVSLDIKSNDSETAVDWMCISQGPACSIWRAYSEDYDIELIDSEGIRTVYVMFKDSAGNVSSPQATDTIIYDKNLPTCGTDWSPNPVSWKTSATTEVFTLTGSSDTGGSGISAASYSCTAAATNGATCSVTISDKAGNTKSCGPSPTNNIDTTAPTCGTDWSPNPVSWKTSATTEVFTLTGSSDTGGSGISAASYSCTAAATNGATCNVTISDKAGNTKSCGPSPTNNIDTEPPTNNSVLIKNGDDYTTSRSVTLSLASTGATQMCISNETTCSTWEAYATSKSWTLTTVDGTKAVYAWFRDTANNTSARVGDVIIFDSTKPTCNPIKTNLYNTTGVTITLNATDATSGLASVYGPYYNITSSKNYRILDKAGNYYDCSVTVSSQRQEKNCTCRKYYDWYRRTYVYYTYNASYSKSTAEATCNNWYRNCVRECHSTCQSKTGIWCCYVCAEYARTAYACSTYSAWNNVASCTPDGYMKLCQTIYY